MNLAPISKIDKQQETKMIHGKITSIITSQDHLRQTLKIHLDGSNLKNYKSPQSNIQFIQQLKSIQESKLNQKEELYKQIEQKKEKKRNEVSDERKAFISDDGTHYVYKRDTDFIVNQSIADNQDGQENSFAGDESLDNPQNHSASFKATLTQPKNDIPHFKKKVISHRKQQINFEKKEQESSKGSFRIKNKSPIVQMNYTLSNNSNSLEASNRNLQNQSFLLQKQNQQKLQKQKTIQYQDGEILSQIDELQSNKKQPPKTIEIRNEQLRQRSQSRSSKSGTQSEFELKQQYQTTKYKSKELNNKKHQSEIANQVNRFDSVNELKDYNNQMKDMMNQTSQNFSSFSKLKENKINTENQNFALTPVNGKNEFIDPLVSFLPQTPMVSLVQKISNNSKMQNKRKSNAIDNVTLNTIYTIQKAEINILRPQSSQQKQKLQIDSLSNYNKILNEQINFPKDQMSLVKVAGNNRNKTPFLNPTQQLQTPKESIFQINGYNNYQHKQVFSPNMNFKPSSMCTVAYPMPSDISSMPRNLKVQSVFNNQSPLSNYGYHNQYIQDKEAFLNHNFNKIFLPKEKIMDIVQGVHNERKTQVNLKNKQIQFDIEKLQWKMAADDVEQKLKFVDRMMNNTFGSKVSDFIPVKNYLPSDLDLDSKAFKSQDKFSRSLQPDPRNVLKTNNQKDHFDFIQNMKMANDIIKREKIKKKQSILNQYKELNQKDMLIMRAIKNRNEYNQTSLFNDKSRTNEENKNIELNENSEIDIKKHQSIQLSNSINYKIAVQDYNKQINSKTNQISTQQKNINAFKYNDKMIKRFSIMSQELKNIESEENEQLKQADKKEASLDLEVALGIQRGQIYDSNSSNTDKVSIHLYNAEEGIQKSNHHLLKHIYSNTNKSGEQSKAKKISSSKVQQESAKQTFKNALQQQSITSQKHNNKNISSSHNENQSLQKQILKKRMDLKDNEFQTKKSNNYRSENVNINIEKSLSSQRKFLATQKQSGLKIVSNSFIIENPQAHYSIIYDKGKVYKTIFRSERNSPISLTQIKSKPSGIVIKHEQNIKNNITANNSAYKLDDSQNILQLPFIAQQPLQMLEGQQIQKKQDLKEINEHLKKENNLKQLQQKYITNKNQCINSQKSLEEEPQTNQMEYTHDDQKLHNQFQINKRSVAGGASSGLEHSSGQGSAQQVYQVFPIGNHLGQNKALMQQQQNVGNNSANFNLNADLYDEHQKNRILNSNNNIFFSSFQQENQEISMNNIQLNTIKHPKETGQSINSSQKRKILLSQMSNSEGSMVSNMIMKSDRIKIHGILNHKIESNQYGIREYNNQTPILKSQISRNTEESKTQTVRTQIEISLKSNNQQDKKHKDKILKQLIEQQSESFSATSESKQ